MLGGDNLENIIINSTRTLTLTNKIPEGNINEDKITVGSDRLYTYFSYLFFDVSTIPSNAEILNAELVLFKTDNFYEDNRKSIYIYPIFDYFNNYTTYKNPPEINHIIEGKLYPLTSKISTTGNITKIVSLWYKNGISNKGIVLCKKNNNFMANFGSAICKDSCLTPFINVSYCKKNTIEIDRSHTNYNYECNPKIGNLTPFKMINNPCHNNCIINCNCNNPCQSPGIPTISQVEIIGTVAPESIYVSIVTLSVTRIATGHIDNYYVTDEYNNHASNTPLAIDKTYNIAVIPQESPGDIENITLAGSYRG